MKEAERLDASLGLFDAYGIELEYMIVDRDSLAVRAAADDLLRWGAIGRALRDEEWPGDVERGEIAWSNELALHLIELKTNGPVASLCGVARSFQKQVQDINALLESVNARLMPTGMHPFMDPSRELKLWPHQGAHIYRALDRIFGCRSHGWANLQSMHLNLPFRGDDEFGRLHAAIRMVLPLLPALAASSPFADGKATGFLDTRLRAYRTHGAAVPSIVGCVIPERACDREEYEERVLGMIYRDLEPHDPQGVLRHEWVNARGCIARFDRMAIEIRLLDVQECPRADLAIAAATVAAVRFLVEENGCSFKSQRGWAEHELEEVLLRAMAEGDRVVISNSRLLEAFGYPDGPRARGGDLWQHLVETCLTHAPGYLEWEEPLQTIFQAGCLARRIERAVGPEASASRLHATYRRLCECLSAGELFP